MISKLCSWKKKFHFITVDLTDMDFYNKILDLDSYAYAIVDGVIVNSK